MILKVWQNTNWKKNLANFTAHCIEFAGKGRIGCKEKIDIFCFRVSPLVHLKGLCRCKPQDFSAEFTSYPMISSPFIDGLVEKLPDHV